MTDGERPTLGDLAQVLGTPLPGASTAHPPTTVTGVTLDSRRVQPGDLYAALPGANVHGARFSAQAATAGAVAVLTDPAGQPDAAATGLPVLVVDDPRAVLGDLAARVHGHPGRALRTVGVTGTNGKTTTAYLVESLLRAAGWTTGLLGTIETRIAGERISSVRTTPEAPDLHALLARMVAAGVRGCALEVSSHALAQHRVDGLVVDVAAFTNLSQDHLDFHGSMQGYFEAKAALFTPGHSRCGVVWVDPTDPDRWGERLADRATVPVSTVGPEGDWRVREVHGERAGSTFRLTGGEPGREVDLHLRCPLPGEFNVANAALAVVAALELGLDPDLLPGALAAAEGVPGRMQPVVREGAPLVVVDYAHTPDALDRVLRTLREATPGRLVAVFGAGGDRDRGKRPLMGAAVAAAADVAVVTDDNPRSEDPAAVRAAVLSGARSVAGGSAEVVEVPDRRAAVAAALARCTGPGDTVLLAGKGHERGQETAGVVAPFDDREVAARELEEWLAVHAARGGTQ
ncbi:UDP-N-acetylmuramoyl-L-alanyl-D-glutamate--2,6-diaminopimelate ligase [Kineococcus sp. SYSU DK001]|uniref:UDP-N-acetylmuramoyl-L-alanyl-D-glutamate--2, 6-diaminopimelate ligase n=1 Tax=Kineococcus sp. SYSU DK001 TaxID=3383122 RepID=UPI003D7C84A7